MTIGYVQDNFIRVILMLPAQTGLVPVEFLVDTRFDGELALPSFILRQLDASFSLWRDCL